VLADERVGEELLEPRDLEPVALERGSVRRFLAERLPLRYQLSEALLEYFAGVTVHVREHRSPRRKSDHPFG
jgi:hypothetical protein